MKQLRKNSEYSFLALVLILTMHYAVLAADEDDQKPNGQPVHQEPSSEAVPKTTFSPKKPQSSSEQPSAGNLPAVSVPLKQEQEFLRSVIAKIPAAKQRDAIELLIKENAIGKRGENSYPNFTKAFVEEKERSKFVENMNAVDKNESARSDFLQGVFKESNERLAAEQKVESEKTAAAAAKKAEEEKKLAEQRRLEEQQALQAAFLQGASRGAQEQAARSGQNGGAGGSGSGGSGNGSGKGAIQPKSDPPSLPKTEGIGDALDKFKHGNDKQNQSISDTRGLLQNQGNFGSGDLKTGSDKNKEDGKSPFDISPKTPKNDETKTSKKEGDASSAAADAAAADPSALALNNGNQNIILSGPTSVPQLAPPTGGGEIPSGGDGDGGGGTPPIKGGPGGGGGGDSGFLGGGDPFKSVGSMEYPELPPPIRKIPFESGGGGDGGGSSGSPEGTAENTDSSTAATKNDKKASLLNELVLTSDNPRARGLGIMAYVGVQTTDLCGRPEAKGVGVCRKRFDIRLEEKLRLKVSPVSASAEEAK